MTSLADAIGRVDKLIEQLERGAFINQVGQSSHAARASNAEVVVGRAASDPEQVVKQPKQAKKKKKAPTTAESTATADVASAEPTIDLLDIRVGKVVEVGPHPDADSLYVEKIDLGESEHRTVVSGLRKFVSEADMLNRTVAVVCNLKPAKMRGILSTGMVLCASNEDHTVVDPILIPEGSTIGSRIMVEGYDRAPMDQINPKKKIFERIAPDMVVSGGGVCEYKGSAFKTDCGGVCTATVPGAHIA